MQSLLAKPICYGKSPHRILNQEVPITENAGACILNKFHLFCLVWSGCHFTSTVFLCHKAGLHWSPNVLTQHLQHLLQSRHIDIRHIKANKTLSLLSSILWLQWGRKTGKMIECDKCHNPDMPRMLREQRKHS